MNRKAIFACINACLVLFIVSSIFSFMDFFVSYLARNVLFWVSIGLGIFLESEFYQWVKKSKRSGYADLLFIAFIFVLMYLVTDDLFTGFLGAFAVYLIIGALELKGHQVVNKIIYISTITYNVLFFAALFDFIFKRTGLPDLGLLNKAFSVSFWLILVLGFVFFGRRYIVVWRFMSPQYITLAFYLLAWVLVATIGSLGHFNIYDPFPWIYPMLLIVDVIVYLGTGVLIDKFLGVKPLKKIDERKAAVIQAVVDKVKQRIGLQGKVKAGYGDYPIINAMAYGPSFDKRICIIAPLEMELPVDELEAIVAHELGHLKCNHPTKLLLINLINLGLCWLLSSNILPATYFPATYYDFAFGKKFLILGFDAGILGYLIFNMIVYVIVYVFVRVMEANADFIVKRAGMGKQLVKALYNLESFYALGKEGGLNVMLLADEKLDIDHAMLNYIEAARTLYKQLVVPPRSIAITTLLNSHPPTFLRIANMLLQDNEEIGAWTAAILPNKFLRKKTVQAFSARTEAIRTEFDTISRAKFLELFAERVGDSLPSFLERIQLPGNRDALLKNQVIAIKKLDGAATHVQLDRMSYHDSITIPYTYEGETTNDKRAIDIVPFEEEFSVLNAGEHYRLKNQGAFTLSAILPGNIKKLECTIVDASGTESTVPFKELKNQVTIEFLVGLPGKSIFLDDNDAIDVIDCEEVVPADRLLDFTIEGHYHHSGEHVSLVLKDYSISRFQLGMQIHEDKRYADRYANFLNWCMVTGVHMLLFLKKPVNNDYSGVVKAVDSDVKTITIVDQFGKEQVMGFKDVELVFIDHETIELKNHKQESVFQKIAFRLRRSRKNMPWIPSW
ncbi:MAG TPA: M48 family metalloprotease [Candidatus Lokiarchaeia archaeon]|nr:M48 family metalloprotease [Candidatus Lokiarchaeia archaeon]